jgi:hypothetical protein
MKFLQSKVKTINGVTKSPYEYFNADKTINVGHYHISRSYGGYSLQRTMNESGGTIDIFSCGHVPARELAALMSAYLIGLTHK